VPLPRVPRPAPFVPVPRWPGRPASGPGSRL